MQENSSDRQVLRAAGRVGAMLFTYAVVLELLAYAFYYVTYFILSGQFTLDYSTVRQYLVKEHYSFVTSTTFSMSLNIMVTGVTITIMMLAGKLFYKADFGGFFRPSKKGFKTGLLWAPGCFLINMILSLVLYYMTEMLSSKGITVPDSDLSVRSPTTLAVVLQFVYVVIMAPLFEEIVYRGVVLGQLSRYGSEAAILLSALSFGLMHGNLPQGISAFATGIIYATIAVNSGSIIPTIVIHSMNNLVANFPELAKGMGLTDYTMPYSALSILIGIAGFYVLFTRFRTLRTERDPRLENGSSVIRTVMTHPLVMVYLLWLVWKIAEGLIRANS